MARARRVIGRAATIPLELETSSTEIHCGRKTRLGPLFYCVGLQGCGWRCVSGAESAEECRITRTPPLDEIDLLRHARRVADDEAKNWNNQGEDPRVASSRVVQLLDHFEHQGPNGRHVCMVLSYWE